VEGSPPGRARSQPAPPERKHTLTRSFGFAWTGLVEAALRERNLRLHLALGVAAAAFAAIAPLGPTSRALVLLCVALVTAAEAANSALEAVVDLLRTGWDERARVAKDASAAAVLALAAGSVFVFLAVAVPALPALAALGARRLAGALLAGGAAALAAGLLPSPSRRARSWDVALAVAGWAGIAGIALLAESQTGTAAAALLLGVGAAAARHRRGQR
jgi:diacylglycerol kinase (ATP)